MFRIVKKVILKCQILSFWPLHPWALAVSNYWSGYPESDAKKSDTHFESPKFILNFSTNFLEIIFFNTRQNWHLWVLWKKIVEVKCVSPIIFTSLYYFVYYKSQPSPYSYFISYESILHNNTFLDPCEIIGEWNEFFYTGILMRNVDLRVFFMSEKYQNQHFRI